MIAFTDELFDGQLLRTLVLRCPKSYLRFSADEGAGDHCVIGNRSLFHERVFHWLSSTLQVN